MSANLAEKPSATRRVSIASLHRFTVEAFKRVGLSPEDSTVGADVLTTTDAWGTFTHGTKLLRGYLRRLKAGGLRFHGRPRLIAEGPAWGIVDGDSALGQVTSVFAMQAAIAKARVSGIAYVGVRNSCHYGAAGYYAWLAAREGLIGLSMANDMPTVAAPGSRGAVTGSNPIAYAVPAGKYPPLLFDISVATVAGGKVYAARTRGEKIPETWLLGPDGKPTTDPSAYPQSGALQPAAGHKGYGLALLIETLAGLLTGAATTWGVGNWLWDDGTKPTDHGAAFLAIHCDAIMPGPQFPSRVADLIEEIHHAPRADGVERVFVPGEMEWNRYAEAKINGISLPPDVTASLEEAAAMVGLDFGTVT